MSAGRLMDAFRMPDHLRGLVSPFAPYAYELPADMLARVCDWCGLHVDAATLGIMAWSKHVAKLALDYENDGPCRGIHGRGDLDFVLSVTPEAVGAIIGGAPVTDVIAAFSRPDRR